MGAARNRRTLYFFAQPRAKRSHTHLGFEDVRSDMLRMTDGAA